MDFFFDFCFFCFPKEHGKIRRNKKGHYFGLTRQPNCFRVVFPRLVMGKQYSSEEPLAKKKSQAGSCIAEGSDS